MLWDGCPNADKFDLQPANVVPFKHTDVLFKLIFWCSSVLGPVNTEIGNQPPTSTQPGHPSVARLQ